LTAPLKRSAIFAPRGQARQYLDHLPQMLRAPGSAEFLYLVLELTSKVESELRSDFQSLKSEEAAVLLLRGRLAKEAETPAQRANAA